MPAKKKRKTKAKPKPYTYKMDMSKPIVNSDGSPAYNKYRAQSQFW
jgi:hypothetical protein